MGDIYILRGKPRGGPQEEDGRNGPSFFRFPGLSGCLAQVPADHEGGWGGPPSAASGNGSAGCGRMGRGSGSGPAARADFRRLSGISDRPARRTGARLDPQWSFVGPGRASTDLRRAEAGVPSIFVGPREGTLSVRQLRPSDVSVGLRTVYPDRRGRDQRRTTGPSRPGAVRGSPSAPRAAEEAAGTGGFSGSGCAIYSGIGHGCDGFIYSFEKMRLLFLDGEEPAGVC